LKDGMTRCLAILMQAAVADARGTG
jgi:hypothetical protein